MNSKRSYTFISPYRGLSSLGSNTKWNEFSVSTARYVDRGQIPPIYIVMHELWEAKAKDLAISVSYTMGAMSIKGGVFETTNPEFTTGKYEETEIAISFAF